MAMASDAISPAAVHNSRSSSKRSPVTFTWTRKALPHNMVRGAMRMAARSASSAGNASAIFGRAPSSVAPRRCRGWLPTLPRACARCRQCAGHRWPPDVRRSAPPSPPPRPGHPIRWRLRCAGAARPDRIQLRFVGHGADQRMVEHVLGLSGESDLIDDLAARRSRQDGINARGFQEVRLNFVPMTAAAPEVFWPPGQAGRRRAAMVACRVAATPPRQHRRLIRRRCGCRAGCRAVPGRARSPQ